MHHDYAVNIFAAFYESFHYDPFDGLWCIQSFIQIQEAKSKKQSMMYILRCLFSSKY